MGSVALIPTPQRAPAVDWKQELEGAKMLLRSGLLPKAITSPETALFIILAGRDLGLSPVQSLRSINVIQGKVEVAADQSLGLYHRAGGKSHFDKLTDTEAVLRFSAPWLLEDHVESFTMADAKRAGLDKPSRSGEPSMFTKFPKAMLRSRAITSGLKSIGFDPTAGVYDYGEIGGPEPEAVSVPTEPEAEMADKAVRDGMSEEDRAQLDAAPDEEELALAEIEAILPELAANQQEYVREKLGDGVDPIALLETLQHKIKRANATA